ncbi:MAG: hypothetical protein JJU33_08235 [Phycisphaerales bacterium]|nr:hypothetical protein [Phycisphaerales bacterium]
MKTEQKKRRWLGSGLLRGAVASLVVGAAVLTGVPVVSQQATAAVMLSASDHILLRDSREFRGEILEETDSHIKMRVSVHGIQTVMTFEKREVLSVKRGEAAAQEDRQAQDRRPDRAEARRADRGDDAARVYVAEFKGHFGRDMAATPMREALEDAARQRADVLVITLDLRSYFAFIQEQRREQGQDEGHFSEMQMTDDIMHLLRVDMQQIFDTPPRVVFWVKQALGGSCFLPLISREIYFHPSGRMGGVGNLDLLFGGMDEVVRQKLISANIEIAKGIAIAGEYPPEIIEAMAMRRQVWSYRLEGGRPVFRQGWPDAGRGEILLTDDGRGENADTIEQIVRGEGNDTLTMTADLALTLGVSRGTVRTLDDLLLEIGVGRNFTRVDERAERIVAGWSRDLVNSERRLRQLFREFQEIQVQGDYNERTRARGRQIRTLEQQILPLIRRFDGSINPFLGVPPVEEIQRIIERIKLEQMADRR